ARTIAVAVGGTKGGGVNEEIPHRPCGARSRFTRARNRTRYGYRRTGLGRKRGRKRGRQLADERGRLPRAGGLAGARRRDVPSGPVRREPLGVVARSRARNRGPRRLGEVLLRRVLD